MTAKYVSDKSNLSFLPVMHSLRLQLVSSVLLPVHTIPFSRLHFLVLFLVEHVSVSRQLDQEDQGNQPPCSLMLYSSRRSGIKASMSLQ